MIPPPLLPEQIQILERSDHHLEILPNEHTATVAKIIAANWDCDGQDVTERHILVTKINSNWSSPELLLSLTGTPTRGHVLIRFERVPPRGDTLRIGGALHDSFVVSADDDRVIRQFVDPVLSHWNDFRFAEVAK
jgi:hypothetical protein